MVRNTFNLFNKSFSGRYDGIEMNVFKELAKIMNFSWKINELGDEVDKWGKQFDGHWVGGIMEPLTEGSAQVGFANIWQSPWQISDLDFTTSWMTVRNQ